MDPINTPLSPAPLSSTAPSDEFLTKREVALMLKKSPCTIDEWLRTGYLSSIKIGHTVFVERRQLICDLQKLTRRGTRR